MEWDFSEIKVGKMINVQAYKHDGFLYRQWTNAKIIFHNKRHIVLSLKGTRVIETLKSRKGWSYKDDALWFIPKKAFYNTIVMFKVGLGKSYYTNLASAPIFEDNTIKFIDYDLDLKSYPTKELQIVDKEEFNENSKRYDYTPIMKSKILNEVKNIVDLYSTNEYFFNDGIIDYYLEIMHKDKLITDNKFEAYRSIKNNSLCEETDMINSLRNFNKTKKHYKN
ncbi:hypothetical protein MCANPG14_00938 [Mycoplasmopsis canis PG 14]|uniref:Protein of uncharacterized function (DUF402) n=1 Tax=Mycoplasmopsis canis TaxID=29555 RepID=A0A449AQE4_9BACT|nr:DUF402 domain-containing protein [Mycoplasmopsis canis]AMD81327.1 rnase g and e associated domain containing protein [Mycoplasmopsis canis PG 14]EIE40530.1 hypothetical protein MCANPG14_00938 [Mycoplasmopsis canis PG 14]VEU68700.1 Protein of uncharacterised function (DUF402) [Mycoplasmopsis canis]